jgi:hypothetical protein
MWFIARFGRIFIGTITTFSMDDLSLIDKIQPNLNLKNMISNLLKGFFMKKIAQIGQISKKNKSKLQYFK